MTKSQANIHSKAKELFWKHGLKKVSVEEICIAAGVSKMTFYRHFKNKIELAKIILDDIMKDGVEKYSEVMMSSLSFPEKIAQVVLLKQANAKGISSEFIKDVYSDEGPLKDHIEKSRHAFEERIYVDFTKAQDEGWIRKDMSMEFIFYMLEVINKEAASPAFLALHKDPEEGIMEMTKLFFYGIIDKIKAKG